MSRCICFASTSNYLFAVANVIIGIEKYNKSNATYKYIIFSPIGEQVDEKIIKALNKIANVSFITFDTKQQLHDLDSDKLKKIRTRFSDMYFAKFGIFDLLSEYEEVVYFDADLLIVDEIDSLFDFIAEKKSNNFICDITIAWRPGRIQFKKRLPLAFISESNTAPNAGVIYVTRNKNNVPISSTTCIKRLIRLSDCIDTITLDELTFGVLAIENNFNVINLPDKFNSAVGWSFKGDEVIIHSIGTKKFWNYAPFVNIFYEWQRNNNKYLSLLNGDDVDKRDLSAASIENKIIKSDYFGVDVCKFLFFIEKYQFWTNLLQSISIYNQEIYPLLDYSRSFFKFHIKNIDRNIYYQIRYIGSQTDVEISLNINIIALLRHAEIIFKNFKNYKINITDKSFSLVRKSSFVSTSIPSRLQYDFNELIATSINLVYILYFHLED